MIPFRVGKIPLTLKKRPRIFFLLFTLISTLYTTKRNLSIVKERIKLLKDCNDSILIRKNIDEKYIPFYQIWKELVYNFTLDVYQYRILNSLSALIELEEVINKTLDGLFNTNHNIDCCKDETLQILNKDKAIEKHNKSLLNRLRNHLGKKTDKPFEQKTLKHQITYAIKELAPVYLIWLFDELKNAIDDNDIASIETLSNAVASQCINNGWSSKALFHSARFLESTDSAETKWNDFVYQFTTRSKETHNVLLSVFFESKRNEVIQDNITTLRELDIEIFSYERLIDRYSSIEDIHTLLNRDKKYLEVQVEATDIYSAAHLAIKQISDKMNMASFYNLISAWDLKTLNIISINTTNNYHRKITAQELYKTYDYIDSSGNIFESTRVILINPQKKALHERLNGAFGFSNISKSSLFQEEKYINIWIAIESLTRTDMYSDIISNVKETLPAALCIRYIYRIIRNFGEDCSRCNIRFDFTTRSIDLRQDTKRKMVKEIIEVLEDNLLFSELKSKCRINSILNYRCDYIRKLIIDANYTKEKIENHYKQIKWQVQRLYRLRNEIVHSALQNNISLIIYIEHMYDYLSILITEVVSCLEGKGLETLEEVFCVIKDNYDVFIEFVKLNQTNVIKEKLLKTGIMNFV